MNLIFNWRRYRIEAAERTTFHGKKVIQKLRAFFVFFIDSSAYFPETHAYPPRIGTTIYCTHLVHLSRLTISLNSQFIEKLIRKLLAFSVFFIDSSAHFPQTNAYLPTAHRNYYRLFTFRSSV